MANRYNNNDAFPRDQNPLNPVGPVLAPGDRNLVAERDHEASNDKAAATRSSSRFKTRKTVTRAPPPKSSQTPQLETALYATAANFPFSRVHFPSVSSYIPSCVSIFFYLNEMDKLMANSKVWVDSCNGWVPPFSQVYIGMLFYIQVMRAMKQAGHLRPGSILLRVFEDFTAAFPLETLNIPGPLVSAFQNLTAFWPFASGNFGNVTPTLPSTPGWNVANQFTFRDSLSFRVPHIAAIFSRLHTICETALDDDLDDASFQRHVRGPRHMQRLFGRDFDNNVFERLLVISPGFNLAYPGNLALWKEAANQLPYLDLPEDLPHDEEITNTWFQAFRLETQSVWFGPVAAMMAKYCQFWNGSIPLSECPSDGSAAGSVVCSYHQPSSIYQVPAWHAPQGDGTSTLHNDPNSIGHYTLHTEPTLTFDVSTCIEDIPYAHVLASLTYQLNIDADAPPAERDLTGQFWLVQPPAYQRSNIQVYTGTAATIAREYHNPANFLPDE